MRALAQGHSRPASAAASGPGGAAVRALLVTSAGLSAASRLSISDGRMKLARRGDKSLGLHPPMASQTAGWRRTIQLTRSSPLGHKVVRRMTGPVPSGIDDIG